MREVVKHECSDSNLSLIRKILPESDCLYSKYQRPGQVEGQGIYFSFDGGASHLGSTDSVSLRRRHKSYRGRLVNKIKLYL